MKKNRGAEQLLCPLCRQPVTKKLYDKITGIWAEKKKIESQFRVKIATLQKEKIDLKERYSKKEKHLRENLKKQALLEVKKETKLLNEKIGKLNKEKAAMSKKAEEKIHEVLKATEIKEKKKYDRQLYQIKRDLDRSVKIELRSKLKEKDLELKLKHKENEARILNNSQTKIEKYQNEMKLVLRRADSLTRTTSEQQKKIEDLQNQLKKQTTPQVEGLLHEDRLLDALKNSFPEDKFNHPGKGGDIIQSIIYKKTSVGTIVYECKKVLKFSGSHIKQAAAAKRQRKAEFAILVTNATKKGYSGFTIEKGVVIIHPAGVLSLAKLLRERIIQIANLNISKSQKNKVIQEIIEYMESAQFKNNLENIILIITEEWDDLQKEVKEHWNRWANKSKHYSELYKDIIDIKQRTLNPITGDKSKLELPPPKFVISLPEAKG